MRGATFHDKRELLAQTGFANVLAERHVTCHQSSRGYLELADANEAYKSKSVPKLDMQKRAVNSQNVI